MHTLLTLLNQNYHEPDSQKNLIEFLGENATNLNDLTHFCETCLWDMNLDYQQSAFNALCQIFSKNIEITFTFGSDVSVWVEKLMDSNEEETIKIIDKFCSHFKRSKSAWHGRIENEENLQKLSTLFTILENVPIETLESIISYRMISLLIMLLKIFDMATIDDRKRKLAVQNRLVKLFSILIDSGYQSKVFLGKIDSFLTMVVKLDQFTMKNKQMLLFASPEISEEIITNFIEEIELNSEDEQFDESCQTLFKVLQSSEDVKSVLNIVWRKLEPLAFDKSIFQNHISAILPLMSVCFEKNEKFQEKSDLCLKMIQKYKSGLVYERLNFIRKHFQLFQANLARLAYRKIINKIIGTNFVEFDRLLTIFPAVLAKFDENDINEWIQGEKSQKIEAIIDFLRLLIAGIDSKTKPNVVQAVKREILLILPQIQTGILDDNQLVLPVLDLLSEILPKCKELKLQHNRLVNDCLSILSMVNLDELNQSIFDRLQSMLVSIFRYHSSTVGNLVPIFMTIIQKMQRKLIEWCCEKNYSEMQRRAMDFGRAATLMMQKCPLDFGKVVPYIVADFMATLKVHPLPMRIRNALLLSYANRLMDMCDDHAVALIATNVDDATKHIFKFLYDDYVKYFKYKGFV